MVHLVRKPACLVTLAPGRVPTLQKISAHYIYVTTYEEMGQTTFAIRSVLFIRNKLKHSDNRGVKREGAKEATDSKRTSGSLGQQGMEHLYMAIQV